MAGHLRGGGSDDLRRYRSMHGTSAIRKQPVQPCLHAPRNSFLSNAFSFAAKSFCRLLGESGLQLSRFLQT